MLIYVIPFILLLVVAIVLKKREASKEAEPKTQKTVAAKNKAKKTTSSKKSPQQTQVVEDVIAKKATTPLATDLRNKIEGQIRDRNFFSAEAQINQALNKDNSQHELYLLLLDIHLLQKDEFAISQLLNHLRSLELDDILAQAEAKKSDYDQLHQNSRDTIEFKPTEIAPSAPKPVEATNTADFDALMSSNNPAPAPVQASVVEPVQDIKPLDFDTSAFTTTTTAQPEPSIEVQSLDFDISSLNTPTAEPTKSAEELKPLDFGSLSLESTPAQPAETSAADIQPLDFSFNLDTAPTTTPGAEISLLAADERPEFTFDFSSESTAEAAKDIPAFSFDTVSPSEAIIEEKPAVVTPSLSFSLESTAPANTTDQSDPLVQSFPQLSEVNEIHLNLELAEQYIQLGAFEAAREILVEQETNYNSEQRQQAEQLLSRIAS
jgi:FimV-like protein